jgi:hypothetical protein
VTFYHALPSIIGFLLGLSVSAVVLGAVNIVLIRKMLETLHQDNIRTEDRLSEHRRGQRR